MAQRDKKEEMELHAPETITLCANNCGFHGNPATNNLCQNCFLASASAAAAASTSSPAPPRSGVDKSRPAAAVEALSQPNPVPSSPAPATATARPVNRCFGCRKRVGLTGFRCRCGELFCGAHRYSDRHECGYDYKAAARDAIAKENPVVRAAKIVRF